MNLNDMALFLDQATILYARRSGSRDYYIQRNAQIRQQHQEGKSIAQLAEDFV